MCYADAKPPFVRLRSLLKLATGALFSPRALVSSVEFCALTVRRERSHAENLAHHRPTRYPALVPNATNVADQFRSLDCWPQIEHHWTGAFVGLTCVALLAAAATCNPAVSPLGAIYFAPIDTQEPERRGSSLSLSCWWLCSRPSGAETDGVIPLAATGATSGTRQPVAVAPREATLRCWPLFYCRAMQFKCSRERRHFAEFEFQCEHSSPRSEPQIT